MNDVSLRDFIIEIMKERDLRRDDLRREDHRWIEREFAALAKALNLQAAEYERRLDMLNHAHEQARVVLGTYVTRELYERAHHEVVETGRKLEIRFTELEARVKSVELGLVNLPGGIKSLELGLAAQSGHLTGTRMTTSTMITIIAVGIAAFGGLVALLNYLGK